MNTKNSTLCRFLKLKHVLEEINQYYFYTNFAHFYLSSAWRFRLRIKEIFKMVENLKRSNNGETINKKPHWTCKIIDSSNLYCNQIKQALVLMTLPASRTEIIYGNHSFLFFYIITCTCLMCALLPKTSINFQHFLWNSEYFFHQHEYQVVSWSCQAGHWKWYICNRNGGQNDRDVMDWMPVR